MQALLKRDSKTDKFSVKPAKFLRTPISKNICEWLLLLSAHVFDDNFEHKFVYLFYTIKEAKTSFVPNNQYHRHVHLDKRLELLWLIYSFSVEHLTLIACQKCYWTALWLIVAPTLYSKQLCQWTNIRDHLSPFVCLASFSVFLSYPF